jgi:uncharacterized protein (TIGR03118 family)
MAIQHQLRLLAGFASLLVWSLSPASLIADVYVQTNLVSSVPGLANTTDSNLVNPWGVSFSATSPFWVADQGASLSTLYDGAGNINATVVSIPGSSTPPSGPTGTVQNPTTGFLVGSTPAHFIFDTLNGTIAAWSSGTTAVTEVSTPGAIYTGLALATSGSNSFLYAANSAAGTINVFNSSFAPATLPGNFTDPSAIAGYVPFNIQLVGSQLYVTYADLDPAGNPIPGSTGYVDVFSTNGTFVQRLATGGPLDAPWGITLAPSGFGSFSNDILVGNFGNGEIDAYSTSGLFQGTIDGLGGTPLVNQDLWALDFRTGGANTNPDTLYFTAGIDNQTQGLFGAITDTPEPSPILLTGLGLLALTLTRLRPLHFQRPTQA